MRKIIKKKKTTLVKIIPFIIAILILIWLYFNHEKFSFETLIQTPPELILSIIGILLIYIAVSTFSNTIIFSNWGYNIPFFSFTLINLASGASNYFGPMKLNFPLRMFLQKKILDIPYNIGSSTKLITVIADIIVLVFFSSFYLLGSNYPIFLTFLPFLIFIAGFTVCLLIAKKSTPTTKYKLLNKSIVFVQKTLSNIGQLSIRKIIIIFLLALVRRALSTFGTFLIISWYTDIISFPHLLAIQSFATFLGLISFMPMGLGVKDISFIEILKSYGVTGDIAFAVIIIERFVWTLIPIVLGIIFLIYLLKKYNIGLIDYETEFEEKD